jgi:hypothetical protein
MDNIRFRPLVELLRRVNDLLPGPGKYKLPGVSEKTQHRWFDLGGHPDLHATEDVGRGLAGGLQGQDKHEARKGIIGEIRRMDPSAQPDNWASGDWKKWFKWLWEQCQKPLDLLTWDDAIKDYSSALLPPRLPVAGKTQFQFRLYLEKPAWCLLVWVDGHGDTQPFGEAGGQPWDSFHFFHVTGERLLEGKPSDPWRLSPEAGAETVVLLASAQPPDELLQRAVKEAFAQTRAMLTRPAGPAGKGKTKAPVPAAPPLQINPLEQAILRVLPRAAGAAPGRARSADADRGLPSWGGLASTDPLQTLYAHLRAQFTPCFDRTVILSFANAGAKEPQP